MLFIVEEPSTIMVAGAPRKCNNKVLIALYHKVTM
jgi:hypothetical protein